ncbi:hypothetical protein ACIOMM_36470 [Streptomyces sp. NPDC087908]|uniref:hypothetical protein n=1 Tax=Streptomyces sp. NPDC087908 TaxID=3365820 RepID=UPI003830AE57
MRFSKRVISTAVTTAAIAGTMIVSAPSASAVAPGGTISYSTLRCTTTVSAGDGVLNCRNKLEGVIWRASVKCLYDPFFIYYGPWRANLNSNVQTSIADSNCLFGVADVSISVQ